MSVLRTVLAELWGLFVDDGSLALALVAWSAVAVWLLPQAPIAPAWRAPVLFLGCVAILIVNVLASAARKSR